MRVLFGSLFCLVIATSLAVPAFAQEQRPGPGGGAGVGPGNRDEMRARIQQKAQTFLTVELSSRLGLDEKKSVRLASSIKDQMERRHARQKKMRDEAQKLRGLVDSKAGDAQIKAQLDLVVSSAQKDQDIKDLLADTGKYLTVTEQAKLALALPEILRDMRGMMRDGHGGGGNRQKMKDRRDGFDDDFDEP